MPYISGIIIIILQGIGGSICWKVMGTYLSSEVYNFKYFSIQIHYCNMDWWFSYELEVCLMFLCVMNSLLKSRKMLHKYVSN
jgi:hypothetical protein